VGLDEVPSAMKAALSRLLARALPSRQVDALRTVWHRAQALDPRKLVLHRRFLRLNQGAAAGEIVLRPGLRLAVDPQAREPFEWFCFRSPEMVRELDGFLAHSKDRRRFLDIGACHGLFALAFTEGRPETEAVAVDPSPLAWEILEANVRKNPGARVTPVRAALGEAPGTLTMRYSWHHLEASPESAGSPGAVEVPVQTVDALCAELGFHPDVVKVDVEGYELAVFRGALRTLREDRPVLFLEIHPQRLRELGHSAGEVATVLRELGYRVFDLSDAPVSAARLAATSAVSRFRCEPAPPDFAI
jgi:FkbM family methyltransferase